MKILLFGVSQVGKSTVAKVLAKKLNCIFIDPDYYIIDKFGSVEEFQKIYYDIRGLFGQTLYLLQLFWQSFHISFFHQYY